MAWALNALLGVCCVLSTAEASTSDVITSTWRLVGEGDGKGMEAQQGVSVRSRLDCVLRCRALSHCSAVVFHPSSLTCLLLPHLNTSLTSYLGQVYVDTDPACQTDNAPSVAGSLSVAWSYALTSLTGEVTCDSGFINTTRDVTLQCASTGSWQTVGKCAQHVWKNLPLPMTALQPPLPVVKGWSVCLEGVPIGNQRFSVNLVIAAGKKALHSDFRFEYGDVDTKGKVLLAYEGPGTYPVADHTTPNPFTEGQPFSLKITATVSDTLKIYANNTLVRQFPQAGDLPATAVKKVFVGYPNQLRITRLDLWCFE